MIPIIQNPLTYENSTCFSAAVASILEIPLDSVPNFMSMNKNYPMVAFNSWLNEFDLHVIFVDFTEMGSVAVQRRRAQSKLNFIKAFTFNYSLGWIYNDKLQCLQAVVVRKGEICHNPHPEQNNYSNEIKCVAIIQTLNITKLSKKIITKKCDCFFPRFTVTSVRCAYCGGVVEKEGSKEEVLSIEDTGVQSFIEASENGVIPIVKAINIFKRAVQLYQSS